jgi:hypothetical protein
MDNIFESEAYRIWMEGISETFRKANKECEKRASKILWEFETKGTAKWEMPYKASDLPDNLDGSIPHI